MKLFSHSQFLYIALPLLVFFASGIDAQAPEEIAVSIATARAVHKGENIVLAMTLNAPAVTTTTISIDIAEVEKTVGKDFIAAAAEGRKEIVFSAGETRKTHSIATTVLDDGDRAVAGSVTVSLVPSSDDTYSIGSPSSISIDIVDDRCGHAVDADTDDDGLIEICDLEDLDAIRYQLDGSGYRASRTAPLFNAGCDEDGDQGNVCRGYELTRSLDFEDAGSYISGSINREWTEGLGWQPIGEVLEAFSGYFEANSFAIINLYINRPVDNVGLIRNIASSALINDLTLLQVNIRGKSQVGALVAVNEGIVSNIDLLNGSIVGIGDNIGGLIGTNKGTVFKSNVIIDTLTGGVTELRCRSDLISTNCADDEKSLIVTARGNNVGGLIGNNEGNLADNFASANVLGGSRVGGLVGIHSVGTFNNNEAGGNVRGNEYAGGLIGYSSGAISGSKSIANVDVTIDGSYAGGLVGYSEAATGNSTADGVEVLGGNYIGGLIGYSKVAISDTMVSNVEVSGRIYAGGLVGYSERTISDSTVSSAEVSGNTYVGGLAGAIETGNILRGNANGSITGNTYAGGLIGKAEGIQIINSTASFSVTAIGNDAENIGGIAGAIEAGSILASNASGEVTGEAAKVGGLVGSIAQSEITKSYANVTVQGSYDVGGLVGNIAQSEIAESYANGNATGTVHSIGGLVGNAFSTTITVAYATGAVTGDNSTNNVGGLIGKAESSMIVKSYALNPLVRGGNKVGGFIGIKTGGMVLNSYTRSSMQGVNRVGGLIGENDGPVAFTYAAAALSASGIDMGGLIGYNHASRSRIVVNNQVANSHWDTTASGTNLSDAGTGFANLRMPTASGTTASEVFYQWNENDWDFGHSAEYPALKDSEARVFPQQTMQLSSLTVGGGLTLIPAFNPNVFDYYIKINDSLNSVSLTITASDSNAIVSVFSSANNNRSTIRGSGTAAIDLNANPALTDIIVARSYRVRVIRPLDITISVDPADMRLNEGQTAYLTVEDNIGNIAPSSYTWRQSNPSTPLLMEGIDAGITVQDPEFSIAIAMDLVPPRETELPITLSVEVTNDITGLDATQSVTLTAIKIRDGIGLALAAAEFVADTTVLQVPNIAEAIASDPDGEAADSDKHIRYLWQYALEGTPWTYIANANNAGIDLTDQNQTAYVRYRQQVRYIDAQGYENSLISAASIAILDKDRDGLIDLYYLEDLDAIRNNLGGEGYQSAPGAVALTYGCPNAVCRGYELRRDLDFLDNDSYRNLSNKSKWTVDDFSDAADTGWDPIEATFSGILDGNGHTLSNLQINRNSERFVGLFRVNNGSIRNIELMNPQVESLNTAGNIGSLAGHNSGRIINSGAVGGSIKAIGNDIGGLIGRNGTFNVDNSEVIIINSYASKMMVSGGGWGGRWSLRFKRR